MLVICFFLPCLGWLSFCRFLHCKSLMNLALMFSFVNQIHQVPSAPLYLSCFKIYCLYCFPLVEPGTWHHLFWDLRTWLILTCQEYLSVFCSPACASGMSLGCLQLYKFYILYSFLQFCHLALFLLVVLGAFHDLLESAFTRVHPRGLHWLCFQLVKIILDHKDPCLHVLLPSFPCPFSLALFTRE